MGPQPLFTLVLFILAWATGACATLPSSPPLANPISPTASRELAQTPETATPFISTPRDLADPCLTPTPFVPVRTLPPQTLVFGLPTPTLIPEPTSLDLRTPSMTWSTYNDPYLGFSFDYPSNWHLDLSEVCDASVPCVEEMMDVRNFEWTAFAYKNHSPQMLQLRVIASPELARCGSVNNWLQESRQLAAKDSGVQFSTPQKMSVNGIAALRFTWGRGMPEWIEVALGKGKWLYQVWASPPNSIHISTFDRLVDSFRVP